MKLSIQSEREEDGRWLAVIPELPGVPAYGARRGEALARAHVLALRVLAERIEHLEISPEPISISIAASASGLPPRYVMYWPLFFASAGASNASRPHTRRFLVKADPTSCLHSTIVMRLVRACSLAWPSTPVLSPGISRARTLRTEARRQSWGQVREALLPPGPDRQGATHVHTSPRRRR